MTIEVEGYSNVPCEECKSLVRNCLRSDGGKPFWRETDDGTRVGHLRQVGETVRVVDPKHHDVDVYLQCPKCGGIWLLHQDLSTWSRLTSLGPVCYDGKWG